MPLYVTNPKGDMEPPRDRRQDDAAPARPARTCTRVRVKAKSLMISVGSGDQCPMWKEQLYQLN